MTDEFIVNTFFVGESNRLTKNYLKIIDDDEAVKEYLNNRYSDSLSYKETLYRIKNNINIHPVCPICGTPTIFIGKGNKIFSVYCSTKCKQKSSIVVEHRKQTMINKYGVDNYAKLNECTIKRKNTCIERYNRIYPYNLEKSKETKLNRYGDAYFNNKEKIIETNIKKYGVEHYTNSEKTKYTCLKKYGVSSYLQTNECREKRKSPESINKEYVTKKKNGTINSSNAENESYNLLKITYADIVRQYKSDAYPFECDFYIPSKDLYIECNYHWTHGKFPYIENEQKCKDKLNIWKLKNTEYYNNAINTWTIRDVRKRTIAKENKLNWIEFFNMDELKTWLQN